MMVVQSEACNSESLERQNGDDKKQRLRQRFQVVKKLGQGTYGKVQLAINKETKQEVAVKTIRKAKIENEQDLLRIRREIQIMSSVQHPHIIHIYEVFENSEKIVFIMQYASGGELYDYLGSHRKLPEKEARRIFRQIAAAIYYCHKNKICHRDLKLENILLDDKGNAKIADFGLSNVFEEKVKLHTFCGSPLYASPEIVKGTPYCGPEVDCWSLGVLLYTLVYGAMPFDGSNFKRLVKQISEGDYYESKLKSKASVIIRRLLTVDVNSRANIKDICKDEWVNEGYDHSLLEVANDLASLTPVSMSTLPTLSRRNEPISSSMKNNLLANLPMIYRDHKLDSELIVKEELPASIKYTNIGQQSSSKIIDDPKRYHTASKAKSLNDSSFTNGESHSMDNAFSDDGDILHRFLSNRIKNSYFSLTGRNSCVNGELYSQDTSALSLIPSAVTDESTLNVNLEGIQQNNNNSSNELLSSHTLNHNSNDISLNNIPDLNTNTTLERTSAVEKFRAWRANLNRVQSNETESILPVFEVTSVIPKRSSNKKETDRDLGKNILEKNEIQMNSENVYIELNEKNNTMPETSDSALCTNATPYVSNTTTTCKGSLTATKGRKDVIDFLNQVCSQRMLSNEHKTQFVSNLKNETTSVSLPSKHKVSNSKKSINNDIDHICADGERESFLSDCGLAEGAQETNGISVSETMEIYENNPVEIRDGLKSFENMKSHPQNAEDKNVVIIEQAAERNDIEEHKLMESHGNSEQNISDNKMSIDVEFSNTSCIEQNECKIIQDEFNLETADLTENYNAEALGTSNSEIELHNNALDGHILPLHCSNDDSTEIEQSDETDRASRSNYKKKIKARSCSVDNDERMSDLEKILRRPRKYSLCALLAASFEFEKLVTNRTRRKSECFKKPPGKVTIPKSFDPSSESEASTPIDKKEIVLIPSISVAENKQKMETKIEKVKLSALSLKPKRKSEANTRRKLKKYTRSCTDVLQCIGNLSDTVNVYQNTASLCCDFNINSISSNPESRFMCNESAGSTECRYAAMNFLDEDGNIPTERLESLEISSLGYVPITRCCKKITFPTKCSENTENKLIWSEDNNDDINNGCMRQGNVDSPEDLSQERKTVCKRKLDRSKQAAHRNGNSELFAKEEKHSASFSCESQGSHSNIDQLQSIESLNSSSFEHDSSDNDDDLNTMVLDSNIEQYESGDLWNFLKSINNDLSRHVKKVKRHPSKPMYLRSKSQECSMLKNSTKLEKSFIRSLSKEEKQTHQVRRISSASSEEVYTNSSLSDMKCSLKQLSQTNNFSQSEFEGIAHLNNNDLRSLQNTTKTRYYSLGNLHDSQSMSSESSLLENPGNSNSEDYIKSINQNDYTIFKKDFPNNSLPRLDQQSIYGTIRPRRLEKNQRSQSYMMLDGMDRGYSMDRPKSLSRFELNRSDKGYSNAVRNKALSDLDISFKTSNILDYNDGNELEKLRFAKSLESKLSLEPRSILLDSQPKSHQRNKLKDDITLKKRGRRVSFSIDAAKEKHSNFAKESIAKAQKALSNVERQPPDNDANEDQGTLLEALKTQGYKTIMSQRLHQTDEMENVPLNRRYSLACLMKYKPCMDDEVFGDSTSQSLIDPAEFAQRIRWSRNFLRSLEDVSNGYNDIEYSEFNSNGFNDAPFRNQTDINGFKLPNTWLYRNAEDLRSVRLSRDNILPVNCNSTYNNDWSMNLAPMNCIESSSDVNIDPCADFDCNGDLILETEQLRNLDRPIEELSMKIKALKNRCQQKNFDESFLGKSATIANSPMLNRHGKKFDDSLLVEDSTRENLEDPDTHLIKGKRYDVDNTPTNINTEGDSNESVSDRIWRKSFYSRFNETSSLRRRRSMLFEQEYPQDELFMKSMKFRTSDNNELENTLTRKTITTTPKESIDRTTCISKPHMDQHHNSSAKCHENIPNHLKISAPTNDLTDSVNETNVDD